MEDFPSFMKQPANLVPKEQQNTAGVDGYVFDGLDGRQVVIWTCHEARESAWHSHAFDEYLVVVAGEYVVQLEGEEILLRPGDEIVIPAGVRQAGRVAAGTRTIHAFGGQRVERPLRAT